jgi:hypothetical protein
MSYILKLGGGGGSTKTLITSKGQVVATRASLTVHPIIPTRVGGVFTPQLSTRPVSLPFPTPKPTMLGGQSLFGGSFKLPQPTGMVQPYRPAITPFPLGGGGSGSTQVVKPLFESLPPIANIGGVPVVTQETITTPTSSSSSSSGGGSNVGLWQGGLLLGPLVLGWLFGTKIIKHRRRFRRPLFRRLRRPSFRRLRRVRRSRRR